MPSLQKPSTASRIAPLAVCLLAAYAFAGCGQKNADTRPGDTAAGKSVQTQTAAMPTPEANIYADEALLAKPYAIIGGTVENVCAERLEKLSVEIELRRRADGGVERREVLVEPGDLEPGGQGKFLLKVLSDVWSGSRVVRLRSGARPQEVAFRPLPGAKRPPERIKDNVIIARPTGQKKPSGGDFINTPDTPYRVP